MVTQVQVIHVPVSLLLNPLSHFGKEIFVIKQYTECNLPIKKPKLHRHQALISFFTAELKTVIQHLNAKSSVLWND